MAKKHNESYDRWIEINMGTQKRRLIEWIAHGHANDRICRSFKISNARLKKFKKKYAVLIVKKKLDLIHSPPEDLPF